MMKKLMVLISCIILCGACSCVVKDASETVQKYLNNYKSLTGEVISEIDSLADSESLSTENKELYKDVLRRQYKDLLYTIENEDYNGDEAQVTVKVTVYDLYKAQVDANKYLQSHREEFMSDGEYDEEKYLKYKLEQMKNTNEAISYNIVLDLKKEDGKWILIQPEGEVLEKLHGVYNYAND